MKTVLTGFSLVTILLLAGCGSSETPQKSIQNTDIKDTSSIQSDIVNHSPIATFDKFTISRNVSYDGQLTATDADGDTLKYIITSQPQHGTVVIHDNGCFTYTPDEGYQGKDTFSYKASDDISSCAIKTVTINVNEPIVQKPTAPTNLKVKTLGTSKLELTWSDNSNNEDGFAIYQDGRLIANASANQTKKVICCGLESGTTYNFEVRAKNQAGSSKATSAKGTTKEVTAPPAAPTELKAKSVGKTCLRLEWKDNADNEKSYEIYQDGKLIKTTSSNCHCLTVGGLKSGTRYSFMVKAINKLGSASSNTISVDTIGDDVVVAQALLGPLSNASFKITKLSSGEVIAEGTTTAGNGTDVATAGLIQVQQAVRDSLAGGLYIIEVTGGTDIDHDDNNVWDIAPTANSGTLHSIMGDDALKDGDFKVNILTEIVFQDLKDELAGGTLTEAQIEAEIKQRAEVLLKGATGGGDVDGDGDIDNDDLIAWNPAEDKPKLRVDYDTVIDPIADKVTAGTDDTVESVAVFTPVNNAPVATVQTVTTNEDTTKAITLSGTDADGDSLTYTVVTQPTHGTYANGVYIPTANYNGSDSFTFKANDGTVDSSPVTVSITINSVNDTPVATAQTVTTNEDTTKAITLSGTDIDGDALTYTVVTQPTHGTYVNGVYTPTANYNGTDSFTFKANDGTVDSAVATVSITINSVNDAPVATAQTVVVKENQQKEITLAGTDADGNDLIYTVVTQPAHGVLSGVLPNLTYTPNKDYPGDDSFTFKVNDGAIDSAVVAVDIDIKGWRLFKERWNEPWYNNMTTIITYTYDSDGNNLTVSYDRGDDGTINSIFTYTYDSNGNKLTDSIDHGADGIIDSISTYTYDSNGNKLTDSVDFDADGAIDFAHTYTYDSNGNKLTDSNEDGTINSIFTYTYDSNGNKLTDSEDYYADGTIDSIATHTYDSNGNNLTHSYDYDADGTIDSIYTHTYDSNGNKLTDSADSDADGIIDNILHIYTWKEI